MIDVPPDRPVAQDVAPAAARPAIRTNRWQEDWSALADPRLRTEPFDRYKYIPLDDDDPDRYISLGATLRERWESLDAPAFGTGGRRGDTYVLQRAQAHADIRFDAHWRAFVQVEDVRSSGKRVPSPTDRNPADLRLAFLAYVAPLAGGTIKARVGRQDFAFDLQRFASLRDGPNVRQSFDAAWADYEHGPWRVIAFASRPVQYADAEAFDDTSNGRLRFHMLRVERHVLGDNELSAFYARYANADAAFLDARGDESRDVLDVRFAGRRGRWDWDVEAMAQHGAVGRSDVRAWAAGARVGHTWTSLPWQPRLGMQVDAASGDERRGDGRLETFNPLFPNGGAYFTLAGFTGYANLVHARPSLTVAPDPRTRISVAYALQWRQTTADAVYVQPVSPVAGTAGRGSRYTGRYTQWRAERTLSPRVGTALEIVHFDVGRTIRDAGGRDGRYIGAELRLAW